MGKDEIILKYKTRIKKLILDSPAFDLYENNCGVAVNLCDYLLGFLSTEEKKNLFRALGMTTTLKPKGFDPFGLREYVVHPDSFSIVEYGKIPLPTGEIDMFGNSCSNVWIKINQESLNVWDIDYVCANPHLARKFFYYIAKWLTFQYAIHLNKPVNLNFVNLSEVENSKGLEKLLGFLK